MTTQVNPAAELVRPIVKSIAELIETGQQETRFNGPKPLEIPEGYGWCGYHGCLHEVSDFNPKPGTKSGLRGYCKVGDVLASRKSKAKSLALKQPDILQKKLAEAVAFLESHGYLIEAPLVVEEAADAPEIGPEPLPEETGDDQPGASSPEEIDEETEAEALAKLEKEAIESSKAAVEEIETQIEATKELVKKAAPKKAAPKKKAPAKKATPKPVAEAVN